MVDVHTKEQRSYNMSQIRSKNTKPELKIKEQMKKEGFNFQSDVYGNPDFINFIKKTVIFVDGCFWHKCPSCFKMPSTNKNFWKGKINKNVIRDMEVTKNYKESGWKVIRIWEHDIKSKDTKKFINNKIINKI